MPRINRVAPGGLVYHVLNRGNARRKIFLKTGDFEAFLELLAEALKRTPGMRLLGFCLMSNHWHLVLWPREDGELSAFMSWLSNTHVRRYHQHYHSYGQGHVYQGRFKSFPIEADDHLLAVLRYVEANPLRANLVERAGDWPWSSLRCRRSPRQRLELLSEWPVDRPANWTALVNEAMKRPGLQAIRSSVSRGTPLGKADWAAAVASRLGLKSTMNPRGRPRKETKS